MFYVPTASGSPYVPVQADFVAKYGVQSVLCFGGLLSSKDLFAVILFSKIQIERETANLCKSLALGVKLSLLPFVDGRAAVSSAEAPDAGQPARNDLPCRDSSRSALIDVSGQLLDFYEDAVRAQSEGIGKARQEVRDRATALERAEQAMREQAQIVNSILHSMGDGVVVTDVDGRLVLFNPAMERILGCSPVDAVPKTWPERFGLFLGDGTTPFPHPSGR